MSWDPAADLKACLGEVVKVMVVELDFPRPFVHLGAGLASDPGTVVLLSGTGLDCARYHIMGAWPWLELKARGPVVRLAIDGRDFRFEADPLAVVRWLLEACRLPRPWPDSPISAGLMGYLAYDLKDLLEELPATCVDDLALPHLVLYSPTVVVVKDRQSGRVRAYGLQRKGGPDVTARLAELEQICKRACCGPGLLEPCPGGFVSTFSREAYLKAVERIREYIAAGDVYQVNFSQRFSVDFRADPYALFARLFELNPAPFFAFVNAGDHQVVSTSPERFVYRSGARVETRPIKGTRPRSTDEARDTENRRQLLASAKDAAELAMIVDLLRNDLGKVCRSGSVKVAEHKRIEAYSNVYHLVSIVQGELEQGKDGVDLVRAAFPGGSITGCPKIRAMEIIDELEPCRRHVYTGSIGYFSFHDSMDLSIAIRTATVVGGKLVFSVGGGIVYDSDPAAEYQETLDKGRTLMEAFGGGQGREQDQRVWMNGRIIPARKAQVPVTSLGLQYGFGFFETIRSLGGRQPLLESHRKRFEKSWKELFGLPGPGLDWKAVIAQVLAANGLQGESAAVKILAAFGTRSRPPLDCNLVVSARPYVHRLKALGVEGLDLATYPHARQSPLAAHKSLNYLFYHLAGKWAVENGFHEALVLNSDGTVSETNTAALVVIRGDRAELPLSSASLPSVMTAAAGQALKRIGYAVETRILKVEDLISADGVFLANALMGLVPALSLDGRPLARAELAWRKLNREILGPGWDE